MNENATHVLTKESAGWESGIMMTGAAGYQQLIDAALACGEAWRARKAFGTQFRHEPRIDQVFLKATAEQLDKTLTNSRRNLERAAIRLENDLSEQRISNKKIKPR